MVPHLRGKLEQRALRLRDDLFQHQLGKLAAFDARIEPFDLAAMAHAMVGVHCRSRQMWLQGGAE